VTEIDRISIVMCDSDQFFSQETAVDSLSRAG